MRTRRLPLAALVASTLLALAASGCGGSSGDAEGVARLDDTSATTTEGNEPAADAGDPQEQALEWARCMRGEGIDVPDPEVDGEGRLTVRPGMGRGRVDANPEKFQAALKECGSPLGNAGPLQLSEEDRQALQESALEFAQCMRDNGVDMPDPDFSEGGVRIGGPGSNFDARDPKFQEAQKACEPIMREAMEARRAGSTP